MTDDANWCQKQNALSEREPSAFMLSSIACIQHGIKKVLPATKPLNILDEVTTPCPRPPPPPPPHTHHHFPPIFNPSKSKFVPGENRHFFAYCSARARVSKIGLSQSASQGPARLQITGMAVKRFPPLTSLERLLAGGTRTGGSSSIDATGDTGHCGASIREHRMTHTLDHQQPHPLAHIVWDALPHDVRQFVRMRERELSPVVNDVLAESPVRCSGGCAGWAIGRDRCMRLGTVGQVCSGGGGADGRRGARPARFAPLVTSRANPAKRIRVKPN